MRRPKNCELHRCAPKDWRHVPNLSGDYDMDKSIMRSNNKNLPDRLKLYRVTSGPVTNYHGYDNYSGDD